MTIGDNGQQRGTTWLFHDGDRVRAKQHEMLEVDERSAAAWLATMGSLLAENLRDEEFTVERMRLLKLWERGRKREQAAIHYRYDPRRRNEALVERDIRIQLSRLGARLKQAERDGRTAS